MEHTYLVPLLYLRHEVVQFPWVHTHCHCFQHQAGMLMAQVDLYEAAAPGHSSSSSSVCRTAADNSFTEPILLQTGEGTGQKGRMLCAWAHSEGCHQVQLGSLLSQR
jgi:hypothetical protein